MKIMNNTGAGQDDNTKIIKNDGTKQGESTAGDMTKSIYDANDNSIVDMAEDSQMLDGKLPSEYLTKSVYDANDNAKVDLAEDAETLLGESPSYYLDLDNHVFGTIPQSQVDNLTSDLVAKQATSGKDASGGYAGLTLFKINFKNALNTFTSFFTNSNTAARTYTFPDRDGSPAIVDSDSSTLSDFIVGSTTGWLKKTLAQTRTILGLATSTDNAIVRADGTAGAVQDSGITIDDSNNIVLPTTAAGAQTGIIYKGSTRFLHNYYPVSAAGFNLFLGSDAGNFTMTYTSGFSSSYNTGVGGLALGGLTTGFSNTAYGYSSGAAITTGNKNFALGAFALFRVTTGTENTVVGASAGSFTTGSYNTLMGTDAGRGVDTLSTYTQNTGIGYSVMYSNKTGNNNTAVGLNSLFTLTTGSNNVAYGWKAGDVLTTGGSNIIIGYDCDPSGATVSNELNIGNVIYGTGMYGSSASIGINGTPNANSVLDLQSTTKPFMPPRMTTTQRDAVASPTAGMVIYNSTTAKLNVYTTAWEAVTSA